VIGCCIVIALCFVGVIGIIRSCNFWIYIFLRVIVVDDIAIFVSEDYSAANLWTVCVTSVGMRSMVQLLRVTCLPEYKLRK